MIAGSYRPNRDGGPNATRLPVDQSDRTPLPGHHPNWQGRSAPPICQRIGQLANHPLRATGLGKSMEIQGNVRHERLDYGFMTLDEGHIQSGHCRLWHL